MAGHRSRSLTAGFLAGIFCLPSFAAAQAWPGEAAEPPAAMRQLQAAGRTGLPGDAGSAFDGGGRARGVVAMADSQEADRLSREAAWAKRAEKTGIQAFKSATRYQRLQERTQERTKEYEELARKLEEANAELKSELKGGVRRVHVLHDRNPAGAH